jgi:hypothetical protein
MTRFRTVLAAALAFLAVPVALSPRESEAFTMIERSAWVLGPGLLSSAGQTAHLCVANMGDGSVRVLMGFLNVLGTRTVLSSMHVTLAAGGGACHDFTNVSVTAPTGDPTAVELVGFVAEMGSGGGTGKAIQSLASSLEIMNNSDSLGRVFLIGLLLPAVQLPAIN